MFVNNEICVPKKKKKNQKKKKKKNNNETYGLYTTLTVSIATFHMYWMAIGENIYSKLSISQSVINIDWQSLYQINA